MTSVEGRLHFSGVSKYYGQVLGIADLTLRVGSGVVGLLGPNGAGKSTLMRLAGGLARPSRGNVRVLGGDPWSYREVRRRVGYCPEHDGAHDERAPRVGEHLRLKGAGGGPDGRVAQFRHEGERSRRRHPVGRRD